MATKRKNAAPKDPNRVALSTHVGKICAYLKVSDSIQARLWAEKLVMELRRLGLVN